MHAPFFIVGTERSGSNLLRVILDSHSRLCVPHPPHIMNYFGHLEARYGDLTQRRARRALAGDIGRLVATHIHPWPFAPDLEAMVDAADPPDLFGLFLALYDQAATFADKPRWGCKSTFMIEHADRIFARFDDAKLVWLVRDPRDVAASSRRSVFSPCHPVLTAELWARQQSEGLALLQRYGPDRVHLLRYEALLDHPVPRLMALCAFLGETFEPPMLSYHRRPEANRGAALSKSWQNLGRPLIRGNVGGYRRTLSDDEVGHIEAICAEPMALLGYERVTSAAMVPLGRRRRLGVRLVNLAQRVGVEAQSWQHDANHWRRWRRAALLTAVAARRRVGAR